MKEIVEKAKVLVEALPYLQKFRGKTFVIKYGGHAMTDENLKISFLRDVVLMRHVGIQPIIVHGGGPQIEELLDKMGIESKFHQGLRITDEKTMEVVEMVLIGKINYDLVAQINRLGGSAVGFAGADGNLIVARKKSAVASSDKPKEIIDLGFVGEIIGINPEILLRTVEQDLFIPVVAPVASGDDGQSLNINADEAACDIAIALRAEKLILMTDVEGVKNKSGQLIREFRRKDIQKNIDDGTVSGGMIPKIKGAQRAVENGVKSVAIVDGRAQHALLLEIFTDSGMGTLIW